ncbi:hypothetical protein GCM10010123_45810 [Pilimelia anulata]|uniref:4Fe-4S Wbl-type domain-containing protein n=1 Tax=Pilimelia anulata TaxID=53371 RepID=A0A8J3FDM3_9ACTN|nr:WhiB family transcriptional regulator [Pilimelia anulata]GGK10637.1 hypothetical protein GCM10010123_45810 [Pilimelia anulata]
MITELSKVAAPAPLVPAQASTSALATVVGAHGVCANAQVTATDDPWFPATEIPDVLAELAREACAGCPALQACRELALRMEASLPGPAIQGLVGGLAPHERIELIRARRAELLRARRGGGAR